MMFFFQSTRSSGTWISWFKSQIVFSVVPWSTIGHRHNDGRVASHPAQFRMALVCWLIGVGTSVPQVGRLFSSGASCRVRFACEVGGRMGSEESRQLSKAEAHQEISLAAAVAPCSVLQVGVSV